MKRKFDLSFLSPSSDSSIGNSSNEDSVTSSEPEKKSRSAKQNEISIRWQENYNFCLQVLNLFGKIPMEIVAKDGSNKVNTSWLYSWIRTQKAALKSQQLPAERRSQIESLFAKFPSLLNSEKIDWDWAVSTTIEFYKTYGQFPQFKKSDLAIGKYSHEEVRRMCSWYNHHRTKYFENEMRPERKESFKNFLIEIEKIRYANWDEKFAEFVTYFEQHKKLPNPLESDSKIGNWVWRIYNPASKLVPILPENIERYEKIKILVDSRRSI